MCLLLSISYCSLLLPLLLLLAANSSAYIPDSSSAAYSLQDELTMVYQLLWQPPTAAPTGQLFCLQQAASLTLRLLPAFRLQ
jgi:hypothetical protein